MAKSKELVKWVEVSPASSETCRVLSENNEQIVSAIKEMLEAQSEQEEEVASRVKHVPSDEPVCVKVGGKCYKPLFEYPMKIKF